MEIRKYNVTTQASRQRQLDVLGAEEQRYDALVTQGLKDNPYHAADNKDGETKKRGHPKQTPAYNLLIRFKVADEN